MNQKEEKLRLLLVLGTHLGYAAEFPNKYSFLILINFLKSGSELIEVIENILKIFPFSLSASFVDKFRHIPVNRTYFNNVKTNSKN